MDKDEFISFIVSIGFKNGPLGFHYVYKKYDIYLGEEYYHFYYGDIWFEYINFNDLTPFENNMIKELRTIKLKALLG